MSDIVEHVLKRIEDKIDSLDNKIDVISQETTRNTVLFETHISQDEKDFSYIREDLKPVVKHVDRINWLFKFMFASGVVTLIVSLVKQL